MKNKSLWIAAFLLLGAIALVYELPTERVNSELERGELSPVQSKPFASAKNCFEAWPTYGAWIDHLRSKLPWWNPKRYMIERRFPQAQFEHVKSTMQCSAITYENDGYTIPGWMLKPNTEPNVALPVIVYNRGGNASYSAITLASLLYNLAPLADQGFIVVASQYRGVVKSDPEKYGLDQFGGDDVRDVTKLVQLASRIPGADENNIFMSGASRGAMMTFLALRDGSPVRAVAVTAGVSDLSEDLKADPRMEKVYAARIPNYSANKIAALRERSVTNWIEELPKSVPILILHGEKDPRVSASQATTLKAMLDKSGYSSKLIIYPGDDHYLSKHKQESVKEVAEWFKSNMAATSQPDTDRDLSNR